MDLQHTVFEYVYHDAGKGKISGKLLLEGTALADDIEALRDCLANRSLFFAELVGIPPLCNERWTISNGISDEDLDFHELIDLRAATVDEILELRLFGEFDSLMNKFERASKLWDNEMLFAL
jgi:hypothetical protein